VGSGVVIIDPLSFLAGCRKRRLNQALSLCCRGVSINDSVSVDLGIDHSGAIANNELVVGVPKYVLLKTILGLRKRLGFARSGRLGTVAADSKYAECSIVFIALLLGHFFT